MSKPNIRFRGYTEDWEQRKLGYVVEVCSGRDYKHLEEGNIPVYGTGGYMLSVSDALSYNEDAIGIGRKGTIDKPYILKAPFWTVDTLFYCVPKAKYDLNFAFDLFQNINWKAMDESTGVPSLSKTIINKVEVLSPTLPEQQKIGNYLNKLDHLITLHQRKCEETRKLKKYMLQKMFPQNGKKFPEIRFKGFTEDWEQRKLGEIADLTSSKRVHAQDYVDSGIPFYRGKEISELREHKPVSEVLYITEEKYKEMAKLYGSPQVGDLLITAVGTIGNTWVVDNVPFYFKDGNLIWFKNIKCNPNYLDYVLSSDDGQKKIDVSAIGSNQKALTMVKLNELKFMFPNDDEQVKIGEYFSCLDNLITLHQQKYEELQKIKKFMLQNMFV